MKSVKSEGGRKKKKGKRTPLPTFIAKMVSIFFKNHQVGSDTLKIVKRHSFRGLLTVDHCRQRRTNRFVLVLKCRLAKEGVDSLVEFFSEGEKGGRGCLKEIRFVRLAEEKYFQVRISMSLAVLENYSRASELIGRLLRQMGGLGLRQPDDVALLQFLGSCEANHVRRRATAWRSIDDERK